jgi:hypothetical protein
MIWRHACVTAEARAGRRDVCPAIFDLRREGEEFSWPEMRKAGAMAGPLIRNDPTDQLSPPPFMSGGNNQVPAWLLVT